MRLPPRLSVDEGCVIIFIFYDYDYYLFLSHELHDDHNEKKQTSVVKIVNREQTEFLS